MKNGSKQRDAGQKADHNISLAKAWHLIGSGLDILGKHEEALQAYVTEFEIETELMPGKWCNFLQYDRGLMGEYALQ